MGFKFSLESIEKISPEKKKVLKFISELNKFSEGYNCQKYTAALELLYRGIKTKITSSNNVFDRVFDIPVGCKFPVMNWCLNKNVKFIKFPQTKFLEFANDTMLKFGRNSRGMCGVKWKGEPGGHIFNLIVIDGVTCMVDSMRKRVIELTDPTIYLRKWVDPKLSLGFFRIDDLNVDQELMENTFDTQTRIYDIDKRTDSRYRSISELLSKHGKQNEDIEIFKKGNSIGSVHCKSSSHAKTRESDKVVWEYMWKS